jgi:hypothetical protein
MGLIPSEVAQGLVAATGGLVGPPSAVVGHAELGEGLELAIEVHMASAADAKTLISQAGSQLQAAALILQVDSAGRLVQKIKVSADGDWARLSWTLSQSELSDLMAATMPGLGGTLDGAPDAGPTGADAGDSSVDKGPGNEENPAPKSGKERIP